jgi:acyl CoA:acetate/3-ketoacid CoA transferase alpha subunit
MNRQYIASMVVASAALVFSLVAAALAGTAVYMTPASEVNGAQLSAVPSIRDDVAIQSFWGAPVGAVDSGGVEADLDGNASALVASD